MSNLLSTKFMEHPTFQNLLKICLSNSAILTGRAKDKALPLLGHLLNPKERIIKRKEQQQRKSFCQLNLNLPQFCANT